MKIFTTLLVCFLPFLNASLLAKPINPTFSEPADTLLLSENQKTENNILSLNTEPDSMANSVKPQTPMLIAQPDYCGMGIGSIDLVPDPNLVCPCSYFWSNGETTEDLTGLTTGMYSVSIIDSNGDWATGTTFVGPGFPAVPIIDGVVTGQTLCNGMGNGAIDLTVSGTIWPVTVAWSNGETTEDISGLAPGDYTVTATIGTTCSAEETFTVPNLTNAPDIVYPGFGTDYCEANTGSASVAGMGGVPPYTFEWSNGGTTALIQDLPAGEYTVTVTGDNGCSNTLSGTVPAGTHDIDIVGWVDLDNTTCIGSNGSISITIAWDPPWIPPPTFLWSNGATTQNITNLSSDSYRVTVTLLGTCTAARTFYIDHEPIFPDLSFSIVAGTCGLSNGSINLTPLPGGVPPYTYLWSNGATTEDLANIPGGTYDVTLTSTTNGCSTTSSTIVDDNEAIFSYSALVTDQTACDTINGRIVLSLFPANLAYQWSNGATTKNLYPLTPGEYTVTISAGGTCTAVETYSVGDIRAYPSIPALVDTSTCGLANGGIDLSVLGNPVTPLTYLWSNGSTNEDLTGILADTFYVTVTSAVGCSAQNTVIVPNFNDTIKLQGIVLDNFSCAAPTGTIELNATPLDTLYTYLWSSGHTTDSLFNLPGGNYLVTVTLGVSCMALDTFAVINNALPPNLATFSTATTCSLNNGAADLNVTGGAAPFSYLWSTTDTTEDLTNLSPGTYTVTVTGMNSCTAVNTVNVLNNNTPVNINGSPLGNTSCASSNGSVDIGVTPAGTYVYNWSNSATTEDLINLAPGSYTVTVSLGSCLSSSTYVVADDALPPNLAAAGTAANCSLSNGAADLSVSGGVGPFTFFWSNAAITEDLNGVAPGTYTVTVTGTNACTAASSVNVLNNTIVLNVNATPAGNTSCTTPDGALDIAVTPAGTYAYAWSNAVNTEDINNLSAGNYTVTVTLGSCQSTGTFAVANNTVTPIIDAGITASVCSANDGSIDLTVSGAAGPYSYIWSNLETTEDLVSLLSGTYSVTVTAVNGCTQIANINVPNNSSTFSLVGAPVPLTDCASNNGAIDLNITPAGAYTYLWSNSSTDEDLNNLAPGTYTVSVTESGSCTATASFFVIDQRTNPNTSQSIQPELCGLSDGSIDITVSGGTGSYGYLWNGGQVVEDLLNIPAGTYTVTVTDTNNCTATASATIPANSISFGLGGTTSASNSCIVSNGSIDLTVVPAPPGYTYTWESGQSTEDLSNLPAGTYTVTVSAGGNCTNTAVFNVISDVPAPLLSQTITLATCGDSTGGIDLSVSGSPFPYQYNWSNAATVEDLNAIVSGIYTVTVTAANGCTSTQSVTVPENVFSPAIASSLTPATSCVSNNGAIDLTINPVGTYTYIWSNAAITEDLINVAAGIYTVTVSAGGACTSTAVLTVASNVPLPTLSSINAAATCGQASGSIDLSVAGSPGPYGYIWSNAETVEDINGIISGSYTVTVTAANGCTVIGNYSVLENTIVPNIASSLTPANSCLTDNGAIDLTITPAIGFIFTWSNGSVTEDLANLVAGSYTVTVNGGGACTNTAGFLIADQTTQPQANIVSNTTTLDCSITAITLNGSVTGTPNPTTTAWSSNGAPVGGGSSIIAVTPGQYDFVVVDDVTFCTATASITITQNLNPPTLSVANPGQLTCALPSQTLSGSSTTGGVQFAWATIIGPDTTIVGSGATLPVNTPGTYYLFGTNPVNQCANATSVVVIANQTPPTADAGTPFSLDCAGETAALTGSGTGAPNLGYQWTSVDGHFVSGANSANPLIDEAGTYSLLITNPANGCTAMDVVTILPETPVVFASVIQPSCMELEGTVLIDSVTGLSDPILYSLNGSQPGSQTQFVGIAPGIYTVSIEGGNGCTATAVVSVEVPEVVIINLTAEAEVDLGYSYQMDVQVNIDLADISSVTWTPAEGLDCPSCLNPLATPLDNTVYEVLVVSNVGCEARGIVNLTVDKTHKIYGPTIFSPNDDGRNETFSVYGNPLTVDRIKSLQVYSRWGEEVYERKDFAPDDQTIGWDGTFKGQKLNPGVFVWQAVVRYADGKEELFTGDVTLQR